MKQCTAFFIVFILYSNLYGQTDTAYIRTYGGVRNDICNQVKPTYDGGYIMIGSTNSFGCGNTSFYVIKTDSVLNHQWSKTYGGSMNQEGFSVATTYDHGYAFLGLTDSYGAGGYDVLLIKTDSLGNEQWEKTYGGSDWDFGYSLQQLADSGYIICGLTYSYGAGNGDVYVIRTDKIGDTVWTKAIGGEGYDVGNSICVANDSLYAIIGNTTSYGLGDTDVFFILMDDKGIIKKDTTYGSTHDDMGYSIRVTLDKGFIIFGCSDSIETGKPDEMLIKADSNGEMEWMQIYHSSGIGIGKDAEQLPDGSYIAVSTSNSFGYGGFAMRIWYINSTGGPIFGPSLGGTSDEEGNSVSIAKNGNVVFAGASNSVGFTEGLNDVMLVRWINGDSINNIRVNFIKNFLDACICIPDYIVSQPTIGAGSKIFPNPISSFATLLVQGSTGEHYFINVYNETGESIIQEVPLQFIGHDQFIKHFEKNNFAAGIYIYQVFNEEGITVTTGKFIVE